MDSTVTEQALQEMTPDERIQHLIDRSYPRYGRAIYRLIGIHAVDSFLRIPDPETKDVVVKAFLARVEDHLNRPGECFGGGPLDHLPQLGIEGITQETYEGLNAAAAGLAGKIIRDSGFPELARKAFAYASQVNARYGLMLAERMSR